MDRRNILSPVTRGSGVMVVHDMLEAHLRNYKVVPLSPYWGMAPPLLTAHRRQPCAITHSQPELGPWVAHPDSDLVATFHNYYLDAPLIADSTMTQALFYRQIMEPSVRASLRRAKWVTAVSRFTAELVQSHHGLGNRLVLIRNGIDTDQFHPAPIAERDEVRILFSGNPIRRKGSEHLAAIADALPDNVVIGFTSGMRDSAIDMPATSSKLVQVPRHSHADMPMVYRSADVLFFPTRREGFGLAVAEAMACGLPVVATRCSSMPELVDHGKGGFLFELDNREQMLAHLTRLARDPVLRAEMGAYNREKILSEFGLQRMLDNYREVFAACNSDP